MVAAQQVLAIIPARGGSKGIPHKNIRVFAGHPLIAYSIAAGLTAETVSRVIVSTDDAEIAAVARQYGAETPFLRPDEISQDNTLDLPVFEHALRWLEEQEDYHPDVVVQLRPTSPVRPRPCVDSAVRLLLDHPQADSVRGVVPAGQNPHKMWKVGQDGQMSPLLRVEGIAEPYNAPRQALPPVYWQTGHIDAIRPNTILNKCSMSGDVILPLMIDPRYTVDIDNLSDWQRAEWLVYQGNLDMIYPGRRPRPLPERVELLVMDFDGVLTDNRVWVDQEGREQVAAYRSDSLGLSLLREMAGIESLVISKEQNPVVGARCRKMKVPYLQGIDDKPAALRQWLAEHHIDPAHVIFLGNDVNDVPCFPVVAWAAAVADAQVGALREADMVLSRKGGYGAVRELCDLLIERVVSGRIPSSGS
ncbi:acylneuraminate cytidylyltransferase [bacterium]|nr:MAG: acylneuraminate cytidylyltransferase [bacterium]